MSGGDAEPGSLLRHLRRRKSDSDGGHVPLEQADDERGNLGDHEDHQRNHRAVAVPVDDETHLLEAFPVRTVNRYLYGKTFWQN
jgi:hypothetical protein